MKSFNWQTPEYFHTEKSRDWYWTVGIIAVALALTAIIFGDVLFGVVILVGSFTLALFASRKPNIVSVEVNEKGVVIEKIFYPFKNLESFSVDTDHHHGPRLLLRSKKAVMPLVAVPLMHDDQDGLKSFLAKRLKEESFEQSFMHTVFEKLGF
jgi:hypothetical protein